MHVEWDARRPTHSAALVGVFFGFFEKTAFYRLIGNNAGHKSSQGLSRIKKEGICDSAVLMLNGLTKFQQCNN